MYRPFDYTYNISTNPYRYRGVYFMLTGHEICAARLYSVLGLGVGGWGLGLGSGWQWGFGGGVWLTDSVILIDTVPPPYCRVVSF